MSNDALQQAHQRSAKARLQRVADALGVPVDSFFAVTPSELHLAGAAELLRLWSELRDENDCAALLSAARDLVRRYDVESAAAG